MPCKPSRDRLIFLWGQKGGGCVNYLILSDFGNKLIFFPPSSPSHPTRKSTPAPCPPTKRPVKARCSNADMSSSVESSPARPPFEDSDSSWYASCFFSLIPQYLILIDYNLLKYCIDYGHGRGYFCIIMLRKRPIRCEKVTD